MVAECDRFPERLVPFARLDPRVVSSRHAAEALAAGARGFKLHPRAEDFKLDDPGVEAICSVAAEARAPVLIHAGAGVGSFGETVTELAARHRGCPLILAHAGVSDLAWLWREVSDHPNLFFDTSWWNPSDLIALFALVPPGQILFGSDEPYMDLELVLAISLRCARFAGLDDDALRIVLGGQAETLLSGGAPLDAGPAPGPVGEARSPLAERLVVLLAGAGGAMLGGGDPSRMLELAGVAVGKDDPASAEISALVEEARGGSPDAPWAMAMALTLALTSGAHRAAFSI